MRAKHLKLAALAFLGMCTVSIPVTVALVLSATGASDVLVVGDVKHATPAEAVRAMRCEPERGYYVLSFDDGPIPRTTRRLVAALRRAHAVATFFDIGERAAARPDLVELQRRVGQVANHSHTHTLLTELSRGQRIEELQQAAKALDYPNAFFRPPYGASSPGVDADIRQTGLTPVYWTVDTQDVSQPVRTITRRALTVRPGGIVLLHDGVEATIDAVPGIVEGLRRRGLCPGFLAPTARRVTGANGAVFNAVAVRP